MFRLALRWRKQHQKVSSKKTERRAWVRQCCSLQSFCQPVTAETAGEPEKQWQATVLDISVAGIGLSISRRFEAGTKLFIEIQSASGSSSRILEAEVIHVSREDKWSWRIGCRFGTELSEADLLSLL